MAENNPFSPKSFADMMQNNDFMKKAQEAEQALTETMVIGRSSSDQVRIRMNCKFERFEIRLAPQSLQAGANELQEQITEAYQHAFYQVQQRLKAHILSLSDAMPPLPDLSGFDDELPALSDQVQEESSR
jgi:DNA-binding protein YbaB